MAVFLGLDTSNYTTSTALYDTETHSVQQQKQLLPVKPGEKGLRQSDAVFHHTVQLPALLEALDIPAEISLLEASDTLPVCNRNAQSFSAVSGSSN